MRVMPAVSRRPAVVAVRGLIDRNRLFTVALVVAALLRLDAELGYRWQSWFNDSWGYVDAAVTLRLDPTRASGYSLYMYLLRPFHSFALVTITQHLMGLAVAVMIYGLARRRFSCPTWLAVLMTLPVLLDGFEIQLEHLIMSDTLFLFLVMVGLTALAWSPLRRPSPGSRVPWWRSTWMRCAVAGLALSASALVRGDGLPLILLVGLWLLLALALSRAGWRGFVACVAAFAVTALAPLAAYSAWYKTQHGQFTTSVSAGVFLYSRVMTFAECSKMGNLPVDLLSLCTAVPPSQRPLAQQYIWGATTPLNRFPSPKFSPLPNSLGEQFAIRAIEAQPLDYARTVFDDTWRTFYWPRTIFPNSDTYDEYLFGYKSVAISGGHRADGYKSSAQAYLAGANPETVIVNPFAGGIRVYQRYVWLPGTVYGLILLAGAFGVVFAWRRRGRDTGLAVLLPWVTSLALIVIPAAVAEFDYRYVTTAVPFACLAVAMAYGRSAPGAVGAGAESGRATGRTGLFPGGRLGRGPVGTGHDQRDLTPDAP